MMSDMPDDAARHAERGKMNTGEGPTSDRLDDIEVRQDGDPGPCRAYIDVFGALRRIPLLDA